MHKNELNISLKFLIFELNMHDFTLQQITQFSILRKILYEDSECQWTYDEYLIYFRNNAVQHWQSKGQPTKDWKLKINLVMIHPLFWKHIYTDKHEINGPILIMFLQYAGYCKYAYLFSLSKMWNHSYMVESKKGRNTDNIPESSSNA